MHCSISLVAFIIRDKEWCPPRRDKFFYGFGLFKLSDSVGLFVWDYNLVELPGFVLGDLMPMLDMDQWETC